MSARSSRIRPWRIATALLFLLASAAAVAAQDQPAPSDPDAPLPSRAAASSAGDVHRFWDRPNAWLFAGVGTARALDYASTLNMRARGDHEALLTDGIVDNHLLFAGIETGGIALSIGTSYLFHRTNHHRLERWVSIVHIGVGIGGALRNYDLKTAH